MNISNRSYVLAQECVEKYITKPDLKLVIKKIKKSWNTLQGNFRLAEELFITAKIQEEDIAFSKFAEIRNYLKFRINQLETRIKQYIYLVQGITIALGIDLLVNLLVANPQILMATTILGISLILFTIFATFQIFSSHYLLAQYRLIQTYFDKESIDNWLKKTEISS